MEFVLVTVTPVRCPLDQNGHISKSIKLQRQPSFNPPPSQRPRPFLAVLIKTQCSDTSLRFTGNLCTVVVRTCSPCVRAVVCVHYHLHWVCEHHTVEANEVLVVQGVHGVDLTDEVLQSVGLTQHIGLQTLHRHVYLETRTGLVFVCLWHKLSVGLRRFMHLL